MLMIWTYADNSKFEAGDNLIFADAGPQSQRACGKGFPGE